MNGRWMGGWVNGQWMGGWVNGRWMGNGWMDGWKDRQIKISLFPASGYTKSQATFFAAYDWTLLGLYI